MISSRRRRGAPVKTWVGEAVTGCPWVLTCYHCYWANPCIHVVHECACKLIIRKWLILIQLSFLHFSWDWSILFLVCLMVFCFNLVRSSFQCRLYACENVHSTNPMTYFAALMKLLENVFCIFFFLVSFYLNSEYKKNNTRTNITWFNDLFWV